MCLLFSFTPALQNACACHWCCVNVCDSHNTVEPTDNFIPQMKNDARFSNWILGVGLQSRLNYPSRCHLGIPCWKLSGKTALVPAHPNRAESFHISPAFYIWAYSPASQEAWPLRVMAGGCNLSATVDSSPFSHWTRPLGLFVTLQLWTACPEQELEGNLIHCVFCAADQTAGLNEGRVGGKNRAGRTGYHTGSETWVLATAQQCRQPCTWTVTGLSLVKGPSIQYQLNSNLVQCSSSTALPQEEERDAQRDVGKSNTLKNEDNLKVL